MPFGRAQDKPTLGKEPNSSTALSDGGELVAFLPGGA
jgi:hypothetical protein